MPTPTPEQLGAPLSGAEAPKAPEALGALQENVETTPLQTAADNSLQRFINLIKERDNFDFAGEHDSADELEQNSAFQTIVAGLKTFFEENAKKTPDAPPRYFSTWMTKSCEFFTGEIEDYDDSSGAMGIMEAEATLEALKDINKTAPRTEIPGIGSFEDWFSTAYPAEYQNWTSEKENAQQSAESLKNKKTELNERAVALEQKFSQMTSTPEIEKNKQELADLKTKIPGAPDLATLAAYETIVVALEGSKIEYEKQAAEKAKTEADTEKEKQEQAAKTAEVKKAEEEAVLDAEEEQDAPIADKLLNFAKRLPEDSKFKSILTTIAGFLVSIGAGMASWPLIGAKIRGTFISNKLLAEKGDITAKKALKTERLFRKYGFSRILANELGGIPTAEAIKTLNQQAAQIKPETITDEAEKKTAEAQKLKFTNLIQVLNDNGGNGNQQSLFDFVDSKNLGASTATAPAQAPAQTAQPQSPTVSPAVAATAAPSTAPAIAPTVVTAAPAVAPVETPAQALEKQRLTKLNEILKNYIGKGKINIKEHPFAFKLPYVDGNQLKEPPCSIQGNIFTVDGKKYNMELSAGAELETIEIAGDATTGVATLEASAFYITQSEKIPLKTLFAKLEEICREKGQSYDITVGSKTAKLVAA